MRGGQARGPLLQRRAPLRDAERRVAPSAEECADVAAPLPPGPLSRRPHEALGEALGREAIPPVVPEKKIEEKPLEAA